MTQLVVRSARVEDAPAIAEVHVTAWQVGYAHLMPAEFLASLDVAEREERWRSMLTRTPRAETLVAERDARIVGICGYGEARDLDDGVSRKGRRVEGVSRKGRRDEDGTGELWMINVHPDAWGTGVADPLLEAAVKGLRTLGYTSAVLWVLEGNARARRFYERHGWVPDGATKQDAFGGAPLTEVRYRTAL
jgi:RimJ/RimL family protein N-acetyltransferase